MTSKMRRSSLAAAGLGVVFMSTVPQAADARPSAARAERAVENSSQGIHHSATRVDCYKSGRTSYSCDVYTALDVGTGHDASYHCTVRYSGGRYSVGRFVRN